MARIPIQLSESEQVIVADERFSHPSGMFAARCSFFGRCIWTHTLKSCPRVAGVGRGRGTFHPAAYRDGGLDGLRRSDVVGPVNTTGQPRRPNTSRPPVRAPWRRRPSASIRRRGFGVGRHRFESFCGIWA